MNELAKRYSLALYELVKETSDFIDAREQLLLIDSLINDNEDFVNILSSPTLTFSTKEELIDKVFYSFDKRIINFLKIITKHSRFKFIHEIIESYISLDNERLGILEGLVYSPFDIEKETLLKIEEAISLKENKKVILKPKIDSTLIGGIKVVINDHIYDGTIKKTITEMKRVIARS